MLIAGLALTVVKAFDKCSIVKKFCTLNKKKTLLVGCHGYMKTQSQDFSIQGVESRMCTVWEQLLVFLALIITVL